MDLFKKYAPKDIATDASDVKFVFSATDSMSGHGNIAQYEDEYRKIVVTNKYVWAAPEVIAAYLVHESVHAKDHDPYTSIKEEQDAYKESVKFWIAHNNGIKDPEMDYAASLYLVSSESLDNKVAEVYFSRDPSIAKVSPHHGLPAQGLFALGIKHGIDKVTNFVKSLLSLNQPQLAAQTSSDQGLLVKHYR